MILKCLFHKMLAASQEKKNNVTAACLAGAGVN